MSLTPRTIAYGITTALAALALLGGGVANFTLQPPVAESMANLGYPEYFARILGAWKVLAAIALLAPKLPRLKEWAYAGITFAMTGAFISHMASGDPLGDSIAPLFVLTFALASYALRPATRRLAGPMI